MDFLTLYDEELLLNLKMQCIDHTLADIPKKFSAIAHEWQQSIDLGIDYNTKLGNDQRDFEIFNRLDKIHSSHLNYMYDYYSSREKLVSSFGGALFYLDGSLTAYNKIGDSKTLDALKENGIRIGTNFCKKNVGCFVANIALNAPFETFFRIGQENYLHIFSEYVCFARYVFKNTKRWRSVNLVFIPIGNYNRDIHNAVVFMLEAEDQAAKSDFLYPYLSKRISFLEHISSSSNDIFMLLDLNKDVLFTNELFQNEFGKAHHDSELEPISTFMPTLSEYPKFKSYTTGKCNFVISLKNAQNQEMQYTVYGTEIPKHGYRLCFIPNIQNRNMNGTKTSYSFGDLIGKSESFQYAINTAQRASQSFNNVLILGASGTGKELVAQAIHAASPRSSSPFVPVNCAAIPRELINSELLGFEEGAFTGARRGGQIGKFELANNGTLFLDEISEMPLETQAVLLRILEDRVINRIGSTKYYPVNVRVIAATNKDLWQCVENETFRLDLYFRLNIIRIVLPPLCERGDDIGLLMSHMLELSSYKNRKALVHMDDDVTKLFYNYSWPGNVRELKNVIERCVFSANTNVITVESLPPDILRLLSPNEKKTENAKEDSASPVDTIVPLKVHEAELIREAMRKCKGNKSDVAKMLGISRSTLYKRLQEAGIDTSKYS